MTSHNNMKLWVTAYRLNCSPNTSLAYLTIGNIHRQRRWQRSHTLSKTSHGGRLETFIQCLLLPTVRLGSVGWVVCEAGVAVGGLQVGGEDLYTRLDKAG